MSLLLTPELLIFKVDCWDVVQLHFQQTEKMHPSGLFLSTHEQRMDSPSYHFFLETSWSEVEQTLLWAFFFPCLLFVYICVTGWKAECDSQTVGACWPWRTTFWQQICFLHWFLFSWLGYLGFCPRVAARLPPRSAGETRNLFLSPSVSHCK